MRRMLTRARLLSAAALAALGLAVPAAAQATFTGTGDPRAGVVNVFTWGHWTFDEYTNNPERYGAFLTHTLWGLSTFRTYFDTKLSDYPSGTFGGGPWVYRDAYGDLVSDGDESGTDPSWYLRDATNTRRVYLLYDCDGTACSQYALDIGNPDMRRWWIDRVLADLAWVDPGASARTLASYNGLLIDDVNMDMRISDGGDRAVAPYDPRTRAPMTEAAWRGYMADFMEEIRTAVKAAHPQAKIAHNAIWAAKTTHYWSRSDPTVLPYRWDDPDIQRQIDAADYFVLERGVADTGVLGGNEADVRFKLEDMFPGESDDRGDSLLKFVDFVHSRDRGVIFAPDRDTLPARTDPTRPPLLPAMTAREVDEYSLAAYFLVSTGHDALADPSGFPDAWWGRGYDLVLGAPEGPREMVSGQPGLLRRRFANGIVYLHVGGWAPATVSTAGKYDLDGNALGATTTLADRQGLIVLDGTGRADPVSTAAPSLSVAVGQQVTASTGAWHGHPWRFAYQWSRCDAAGAGCTPIAGATAKTYTAQSADAGGTVKVTVTASNSQGATAATSTQTIAVSP